MSEENKSQGKQKVVEIKLKRRPNRNEVIILRKLPISGMGKDELYDLLYDHISEDKDLLVKSDLDFFWEVLRWSPIVDERTGRRAGQDIKEMAKFSRIADELIRIESKVFDGGEPIIKISRDDIAELQKRVKNIKRDTYEHSYVEFLRDMEVVTGMTFITTSSE